MHQTYLFIFPHNLIIKTNIISASFVLFSTISHFHSKSHCHHKSTIKESAAALQSKKLINQHLITITMGQIGLKLALALAKFAASFDKDLGEDQDHLCIPDFKRMTSELEGQ